MPTERTIAWGESLEQFITPRHAVGVRSISAAVHTQCARLEWLLERVEPVVSPWFRDLDLDWLVARLEPMIGEKDVPVLIAAVMREVKTQTQSYPSPLAALYVLDAVEQEIFRRRG